MMDAEMKRFLLWAVVVGIVTALLLCLKFKDKQCAYSDGRTPSERFEGKYIVCKKCGGPVEIQTVSESRKTGCLTVLLYILLAATILGLLIVIPLALRKKTETHTYATCQKCGYRQEITS